MKTITVSGADVSCFHLAARLYGDHTQYWRLMQANGLTDPEITSMSTLVVPSPNPGLSGGVPPQ